MSSQQEDSQVPAPAGYEVQYPIEGAPPPIQYNPPGLQKPIGMERCVICNAFTEYSCDKCGAACHRACRERHDKIAHPNMRKQPKVGFL